MALAPEVTQQQYDTSVTAATQAYQDLNTLQGIYDRYGIPIPSALRDAIDALLQSSAQQIRDYTVNNQVAAV